MMRAFADGSYTRTGRACSPCIQILHRDDYMWAILHLFALPPETPFLTNIHYTTTPADLDRLYVTTTANSVAFVRLTLRNWPVKPGSFLIMLPLRLPTGGTFLQPQVLLSASTILRYRCPRVHCILHKKRSDCRVRWSHLANRHA